MLREIQTFIAVCRSGTFTAAAERLGMTQSAVSGHMQRLEAFTGTPLFHRTGRSATLNPDGRAMLPAAEEAVLLLEHMRTRAAPGVLRGTLRVGTISSMHTTLMARAMVAFRAAHPLVSLRVIRQDSHMLGQVERAEFDLAVTSRPDQPVAGSMVWQPLLRKPFVLIAPTACRARGWRRAVLAHPLLRYDESSAPGKEIDEFLRRVGVSVRESVWVNYLDVMISLVAQGLGVAIIPRTPLGEVASLVREYSLGAHGLDREIGVIRRASAPNGGAIADEFLQILISEGGKEPYAAPAGERRER